MPGSVPDFRVPRWTEIPMTPKAATLLGVAGIVCILLSTLFGVSAASDWLLVAAQGLLLLGFIVFTVYILVGIIGDAGTT